MGLSSPLKSGFIPTHQNDICSFQIQKSSRLNDKKFDNFHKVISILYCPLCAVLNTARNTEYFFS